MKPTLPKTFRSLPLMALLSFSLPVALGEARAQDSSAKKDMLTPEEVPLETPNAVPSNQNGPFLGATFSLGQGRTTENNGNPGIATFLKLEPGYQIGTSSWNRIEVSGELLQGTLAFRQTTGPLSGKHRLDVNVGFMAKFGYGYSLGNKMFGLAKIGAGALSGKLKASANDQTVESDRITGTALSLGWTMVLPLSDKLDFSGGFTWLHTEFDVGSLKSGPAVYDYGRNLVVNVPSLDLGIRVRI